MADYVWWFLIVGIVVGGALVAAISMDWSRREEDLDADERNAEATALAGQLAAEGHGVDRETVAAILRAHRDYKRLPPPDRLERVDGPEAGAMRPTASDEVDDDGLAVLVRPHEPPAPPVSEG